ncbi:MAG: hypothetical protein U0R17_06285 [Acidimicrobiia bacterium]
MNSSNSLIVYVYTIYSILAVGIIAWLASTLFRNGAHFLDVVFKDNNVFQE